MNDTGDTRTPAQHAAAEHLRLLTAADLDAWAALFATDATFTFPFAPPGMVTEVHGREALHAHMRGFTETFDARLVDLTFIATAGSRVAVARGKLDGTARPTGKRFQQDFIVVVHTDTDGLITRFDDYWNPLAAVEALTPAEA
ncbi:nuclear transport factor 2 family protein [Actinoplanes derwentensis]|uniref:SnoaL-like domain-containing protein n=1 Tax=Actinoplanes derwentensis TaxID=113562 RepID=A0A1H1U880_9ACTN|nr:nuclear transport factor 2 family protein [Actinoplanes derwentensis]GID85225.1 hypothetical protein Ade03nite_41490 [Actinoplanes derwentensis]SDS68583.1 hypothetical protein SAMN04489716_1360 [Actinoplanes derwentensis]